MDRGRSQICVVAPNADLAPLFFGAKEVNILQHTAAVKSLILNRSDAAWDRDAFQRRAVNEHAHPNGVNIREDEIAQRGIIAEGKLTDVRDVGRDADGIKAGTECQRQNTDPGQAGGQIDLLQIPAVDENVVSDLRDPLADHNAFYKVFRPRRRIIGRIAVIPAVIGI